MSSVTNTPPSNGLSSGPLGGERQTLRTRGGEAEEEEGAHEISASHSKKFSSDLGPGMERKKRKEVQRKRVSMLSSAHCSPATIPSGEFMVNSTVVCT